MAKILRVRFDITYDDWAEIVSPVIHNTRSITNLQTAALANSEHNGTSSDKIRTTWDMSKSGLAAVIFKFKDDDIITIDTAKKAIKTDSGYNERSAASILSRLRRDGFLTRVGYGRYKIIKRVSGA